MKRITAYKALDGSLHETKIGAAFASLEHLGKTLNSDQRGTSLGGAEAAFIIKHREKILPLLQAIDAPEAKE